jgi:biopolymer transport protein ExbD
MMNKRRFRQNAVEEPAVNLTPLIDVVFVILIMFIVVAPLLELDRVELAEAPKQGKDVFAVQENGPISLHVRKDNTLWFNHKQTDLASVVPLLKKAKLLYPQVRPQLFHDKQAHFGTYQAVKNAVEEAGFEQMDIILKP